MKIKAVIFDSSVLLKIPTKELKESFKKIVGKDFDKVMKAYKLNFSKFQKGGLDEDGFFGKLPKGLKSRHNKKRDELVKLQKDIKAVLEALTTNYKLSLVSNMPKEWFLNDAKRLGINLKLFSSMIFGSDLKLLKPDILVYKKAIISLKERPERCVYVTNDDYEVAGAREAGLTVVTIGSDSGDLRIDSLRELITLFSEEDVMPKQVHEVDMP